MLGDVVLPIESIDPTKAPAKSFRYVDVSSVSNETFEIVESSELAGRDAPSRARRKIRAGDVIFATIRPTLKRIAIVPPELDGEVCSTGYFVFRTKPFLDSRYLFYWLLTNTFFEAMERLQTGASYPAVNDTQVRQQEIVYPPLPEQQSIVAILDEAFAGLATATANAEKNLKNARELFESYLQAVFDQTKPLSLAKDNTKDSANWHGTPKLDGAESTRTGGRAASTRHIEGLRSLCVGMPKSKARSGWAWRALGTLAQMESGHTPSRRHPEYWDGDVPWIGIRDAKSAHGREILETLETTNALGLENSSARLLPAQTVLSLTNRIGRLCDCDGAADGHQPRFC